MKPPKDFADCVPGPRELNPREIVGPPIHHSLEITDLQRRVDQYFQSGQRREPAGRLILDLLRALRKTGAELDELREAYGRLMQEIVDRGKRAGR